MALQAGALRKALISMNVIEELADKASEEAAEHTIAIVNLRGDMKQIKWILGTNILATFGILWLVIRIVGQTHIGGG